MVESNFPGADWITRKYGVMTHENACKAVKKLNRNCAVYGVPRYYFLTRVLDC